MNIYDTVKASVTAREAAERYGIKANRHGMAICVFHKDRNASLQLYPGDRGYFCHGCHAGGDVISLVARLFDLSRKDACTKLANDFGIATTGWRPIDSVVVRERQRQRLEADRLKQAEQRFFVTLCDVILALKRRCADLVPEDPGAEWSDAFAETVGLMGELESVADRWLEADEEKKKQLFIENGKRVLQLDEQIRERGEGFGGSHGHVRPAAAG